MHRVRQEGLEGPRFASRLLLQSGEEESELRVLLAFGQDLLKVTLLRKEGSTVHNMYLWSVLTDDGTELSDVEIGKT